jgi:N-acetylmuramoyl-L-alanine amidase
LKLKSLKTIAAALSVISISIFSIPHTIASATSPVILIDPGHASRSNLEKEAIAPGSSIMKIKDGGGAQGIITKTPEYAINMKIATILKSSLVKKGYTVVMTKTSNDKSMGNRERAEVGNKNNAALVIRIHADSSENSSVNGASMLVPTLNNQYMKITPDLRNAYIKSKSYGTTILNTLVSEVGMKNRGVAARDDMTGFNWSKVPVVLIEAGFLSNSREDKLLNSTAYQTKIANALSDGISKTIIISKKKPSK